MHVVYLHAARAVCSFYSRFVVFLLRFRMFLLLVFVLLPRLSRKARQQTVGKGAYLVLAPRTMDSKHYC